MLRLFLLTLTLFVGLLKARPQDLTSPSPVNIFEDLSGSDWALSDQSLSFESIPSAYDGSGIVDQPQPFNPADPGPSPENLHLGSLFSNTDNFDMSDSSLYASSPFSPNDVNSAEADFGTGSADDALQIDEGSTIAYEKSPLYTWPSDENRLVFPMNCWKEGKNGYICNDTNCRKGKIAVKFFNLC